ncbi:hypothetical protein [Cupriavidus gilardii]|uniref:hypothetical protein n=1 Tax=Cupriavidus gilardii TaxID=82541 RepID=UPI0021B2FBF3|nr:hypothetical protein [Cupriavidus gilardii]UXC34560.1 hypothetical protein N4G38_08810 [Cupriavidus gilardii]UXC38809.1 hypothetical protein N4G38_18085 [Cupriavidus gilardii]
MSFSLPERIDPRHCIVTKQYAIYTPPMHAMIEQMGEWIDQQRPGGYIYGASRLGKSRCVQWYVGKVLEERFSAVVPWWYGADAPTVIPTKRRSGIRF